MGVTIGYDAEKLVKHSFFIDNAREAIAENWFDWLEEPESINKMKQL